MTLQEQGLQIIEKHGLQTLLENYGETHLVGNIALDTTIKPDIDFQIYCDIQTWQETTQSIISDFHNLGVDDYITRDIEGSGKSLVSFATIEDGLRWTIDVTLLERGGASDKDAYMFYLRYKDKLTDENTEVIRNLKTSYKEQGLLKDNLTYYIYLAVLDEGSRTEAEVNDYYAKQKGN